MGSSEGTQRQSITQLQATIETLRQELNDVTNGGENSREELRKLRAELKAAQDELAAAKQEKKPADRPEGGHDEETGKPEGHDSPAHFGWRSRRG
jgi:uncharacterized phage infection (PIP) family protein YhgE